ncbi:Swi five-dependent recombination repair protein Sfr1 [Chamberlinius hualienensis]
MEFLGTPKRTQSKMSSGLKEKLKRLGRYHGSSGSPSLSRPTSTCNSFNSNCTNSPVDDRNSGILRRNKSTLLTDRDPPDDPRPFQLVVESSESANLSDLSKTAGSDDNFSEFNENNIFALEKTIKLWKEKEQNYKETLRKLNLVKLYENKNNLVKLEELITNWRAACQNALAELLSKYPDPKPSMEELLSFLKIDEKLVKYDPEEESFN